MAVHLGVSTDVANLWNAFVAMHAPKETLFGIEGKIMIEKKTEYSSNKTIFFTSKWHTLEFII